MIAALCWIIGFMFAFFPLYALGLLGFPRRTVVLFRSGLPALDDGGAVRRGLVLVALACLIIQLIRFRPRPRRKPRSGRRSMGRQQPGMGDPRPRAGIQFPGHPHNQRPRPLHHRQGEGGGLPGRRTNSPISGCRRTARSGIDPLRHRRLRWPSAWSGTSGGLSRLAMLAASSAIIAPGLCAGRREGHSRRRGAAGARALAGDGRRAASRSPANWRPRRKTAALPRVTSMPEAAE